MLLPNKSQNLVMYGNIMTKFVCLIKTHNSLYVLILIIRIMFINNADTYSILFQLDILGNTGLY